MRANQLLFRKFTRRDFQELKSWFAGSNSHDMDYDPDETWFEHTQTPDVVAVAVSDETGQLVAVIQLDKEPNLDGYFNIFVKPNLPEKDIAALTISEFMANYTQGVRELISFASTNQTNWQSVLMENGFSTDGYVDDQGLIKFARTMDHTIESMAS